MNGVNRDLEDWQSFVKYGIDRTRQLTWEKAAKSRANYKGVEGGVDDFTTRKLYNKLAQKQSMNAGALHTIITDGVWYPERANKRGKMKMACALFANVDKKEDCSTFGGNMELVTLSQITIGCNCKKLNKTNEFAATLPLDHRRYYERVHNFA
eukprot:16449476-Heterocapsa_arctica.AAC.1